MNRRDRRAAARKPNTTCTGAVPVTSSAAPVTSSAGSIAGSLYEPARRHLQSGRLADAEHCCRQALAVEPEHADALHLMGRLSLQAKQPLKAVEWIAQAVRLAPKPEYLASLGVALQQLGRRDEALRAFDTAIQLKPDGTELWQQFAQLLLDMQRYDDALLSFQKLLKLDPRHQDASYKSAVLLNAAGRFEEALASINLCDELLPNRAPTLKVRAHALYNLGRFDAALADNIRANKLDPDNADTCNNIGACLKALGREEEALSWFDRALRGLPNAIEILNNKALMLGQLQRFDEAFALYERIKVLGVNNATTDWNWALLNLLTGNFEAGWAGRESSWRITSPHAYPVFDQPAWSGKESIDGKTVLIHVDEGLGDTIQFARYLPMVAARGARIILVVERPLQSLLSALPCVAQCLSYPAEPSPSFDMHCPMGSLPLIFETRIDTIPATSYLPLPAQPRRQIWEQRLGPHDRLRVGLVWSGNPTHKNDVNRSMSYEQVSRILDVDATFVSLQKDPKPSDRVLLAQSKLVDLTAYLTDFAETAALIGCLDLVMSVDTSVAHLAGALGCPTWIMLPWTPDYRWLLGRDDSPWYPTVRLFRQTETRDYTSVLERVRAELVAWVSARKDGAAVASHRTR